MSKTDYIHALLKGRIYNGMLLQAALVYWHSSISFADACGYMDILYRKLDLEPANT